MHKGECLGILGKSGSGKSLSVKISATWQSHGNLSKKQLYNNAVKMLVSMKLMNPTQVLCKKYAKTLLHSIVDMKGIEDEEQFNDRRKYFQRTYLIFDSDVSQ